MSVADNRPCLFLSGSFQGLIGGPNLFNWLRIEDRGLSEFEVTFTKEVLKLARSTVKLVDFERALHFSWLKILTG